jgi:hypothetical protein
MSRCQTYLEHIGYLPPLQGVKHRQLIAGEAVTLRNCLQDDGGNSLYSAAVSLADALRGLRDGFYTWATVKLYYAVFYTARCELALRDIALFYIGGKPCTILTSAGATLAPQKGTTHEVVLDQFSRLFPNSPFLSQTIDGKPPLTWLRERRENANYKNARFVEPNDPTHFRGVVTEGVRRATLAYLSPTGLTTYSFDPEHAMLAFPLRFWRDAVSEARAAGLPDTIADEVDFLSKAFSDGSGPLSEIIRVIA